MTTLVIGIVAHLALAQVDPQHPAARPTVRALCLMGGEFHQYEKNMSSLVKQLERSIDLRAELVRIDHPPEGKPQAEKALLPSRPEVLADPDLRKKYDVIIAYHQESYVELKDNERDGLLDFVRRGGGWVGMHSASDTMKSCDEYIRMVGGRFESHPPFGDVSVRRVAGSHPVLSGIDDFALKDEFYHLNSCPLEDKDILLVGDSPKDHVTRPVAWTRRYGRGKVFYTILGHGPETFENPTFVKLLTQAVEWAAEPDPGQPDASGEINLFDGRDLRGWTMTGPGRFVVEDGTLKTEGGMGLLWYEAQRFRDFTLKLDFKVEHDDDNSGVFVRFDDMPRTPWDAVSGGYEIQICDRAGEKSNTGSIYSFAPATKAASKPPGEWNHLEITVKEQHYEVLLNDERVCTFDGDRGRSGYIGLQNHDARSVARFRNVKVRELP